MSKENLQELSYEELLAKATQFEKYYDSVTKGAKKFLSNNQNIRLFNSCKGNATKRGIEFSLTLDDFVFPEKCIYLDVPLTNVTGQGRVKHNVSVDRIDSSKGYVKGNVQFISDLANRMKQNATEEELVTFAKNILKLHGE